MNLGQPSLIQEQRTLFSDKDRPATIFLLVLAFYFLLHVVIRVSLPDSLELDEAEQAFSFQQLRLGYGTQPPLYAWLQWVAFSLFGINLFALSALKNLLLFATYAGMFHLARRMIGVSGAMAVTASLLLFPEFAWESQVDRTHSVLLAAISCATLSTYFSLLKHPTTIRYALFGLLAGLGLQSKYNFGVFLAGLSIASLMVPEHRQKIWNRKVWIAVAVALLCLLPHAFWLLNHLDAASSDTLQKMRGDDPDAGYLLNVADGLGSMLAGTAAFITPLWLVYAFACRRYRKQAVIDRQNSDVRFFLCLYAAFFALMIVLVLTEQVRDVSGRWLLPLLLSLPLAFFVALPAFAQPAVYRPILRAATFFAVLMLLAIPLRGFFGPILGKYTRLHHPYPRLSTELARQFPLARIIISDDRLIAGNLFFQRPRLPTLLLSEAVKQHVRLNSAVLLVEPSGKQAESLEEFRAAYPYSEVRQQGRLDLPYRRGRGETISFEYAYIVVRSQ